MTVLVLVTLLFIVLAILFINGKASSLIAGYNTMSPEQKAEYDIAALSKFMGKTMFALSGCLVMLTLGIVWESNGLANTGGILIIAVTLFAVIFSSTGNRFKKNANSTQL